MKLRPLQGFQQEESDQEQLIADAIGNSPQYDYDAWNRLAGYDTDMTVNASRYEYPYDALHRRVIDYKYIDYGQSQPPDPEVTRIDLYYSNRWQVIEDNSEHSGP